MPIGGFTPPTGPAGGMSRDGHVQVHVSKSEKSKFFVVAFLTLLVGVFVFHLSGIGGLIS